MIIDCHGHFTTAPPALDRFRAAQLARLGGPGGPDPVALDISEAPDISDEALRDSIEPNQLRLMDERGIDLVLLSPKASAMGHHVPDRSSAAAWARCSNDLVHRVVQLFPERFAGVCQLPQTPGGSLDDPIAEVRRCVEELGFVGVNVSPDPSGGHWTSPPFTDAYWYPLFEAMVELDVPGMVHVSSSCTPAVHALGAHYLNADTTVFMQLVEGDLFADLPELRLVVPHGGGAVPYHWGRYQGLAARLGRPPVEAHVMGNVFFDTCVYHQAGMDLLHRVVGRSNILFASEMLGAVRGDNPETGAGWDDTKRYLDRVRLDPQDRHRVEEGNARRVYPRLDARLKAQGR